MKRLDAVVYDLEIVKAVPKPDEERFEDIEYCAGWGDKRGMGMSVLCALDLLTGMPHVYLEDNIDEFADLCQAREHVVGFNSINFDDKVLWEACGLRVETTYDLKVEAGGVAPGGTRVKGRGLDDFARVNLGEVKTEKGAFAPILWQRGERGRVIDYCMSDVMLTAKLVAKLPTLIDPVTMREITLRPIVETRQEVLL